MGSTMREPAAGLQRFIGAAHVVGSCHMGNFSRDMIVPMDVITGRKQQMRIICSLPSRSVPLLPRSPNLIEGEDNTATSNEGVGAEQGSRMRSKRHCLGPGSRHALQIAPADQSQSTSTTDTKCHYER